VGYGFPLDAAPRPVMEMVRRLEQTRYRVLADVKPSVIEIRT
jgi:hypothetical protein